MRNDNGPHFVCLLLDKRLACARLDPCCLWVNTVQNSRTKFHATKKKNTGTHTRRERLP